MLHTTPQQRRQEDNRERILEAAALVIQQDGLEGLSIKKVSSLANYTPGALYRYYASKDALVAALTVRAIDELAQIMMIASQGPGLQSITGQAHAYLQYSHARPAMYSLLAALNGTPRVVIPDEENARTIANAMIAALLPLAGSFGRCAGEGLLEPGDARERAVLFWAAVQGALQLRKQERVAPDFFNAERLSRRMVATLLRGWGADAEDVTQALSSFGAGDETP